MYQFGLQILVLTAACVRTHRERKEAYTKYLEQEVVQLRANEARILGEMRRIYEELAEVKNLINLHGIKVPATHGQSQLNAGFASLPASDREIFDLNIRITNTKQKRRQIQVFKPSFHDQHDPVTGFNQTSPSQYRTLHAILVRHSR